MSIECGICERDLRGEHDEDCPYHSSNVIANLKKQLADERAKGEIAALEARQVLEQFKSSAPHPEWSFPQSAGVRTVDEFLVDYLASEAWRPRTEVEALKEQLSDEKVKTAELAATAKRMRQQVYAMVDPHGLDFSDETKREALEILLNESIGSADAILAEHDAEIMRKERAKTVELERQLSEAKADTERLNAVIRAMDHRAAKLLSPTDGHRWRLFRWGETRREAIDPACKERG